jgi:hypothetical protein
MSDSILMVPGLHRILFHLHRHVSVLRDRAQCCAIEVAPSMGSVHGFLEARGEYGPVGTIRENVGDFGRDFHSSKKSCSTCFLQQQ